MSRHPHRPRRGAERCRTRHRNVRVALRLVISFDPESLDPILYNASIADITIRSMTDTLLRFTDDLRVGPGLVRGWEIVDDGARYTFHLQPGVAFDDGAPCDAEAVRYNLARYSGNTASSWHSDLAGLRGIEVIDPFTLALEFDAPNASMPSKLASGAGIVVSPSIVEQRGDHLRGDFTNAGCGPWSFESWQPGIGIVATRSPHYREIDGRDARLPYLDRLELSPVGDEYRRLEALRTGQVDALASYLGGPPPSEIAAIKQDPDLIYRDEPGLAYSGLYLSLARPPFDRREVRQALALAIDPDGQVYAAFHSQGSSNSSRYRSATLDNLLDTGRRTLDATARVPIYREANRILAEDAPMIVLYNPTNHIVTRPQIQDFPLGPAATIRFPAVWKQA